MKAVLFDLDGTLVRAGGAGRRALNRAVEHLHGAKEVCSEFSLAGRTDLDNFRLALRAALGRSPTPAETEAVEAAYLRRLPREVKDAVDSGRYELVPGIGRLLRELKRLPGVLLGLGTGNVKPGARLKLRPSGLLDHFTFGGFGCDGYTRVSVLRTAVRRASAATGRRIPPDAVYVIGDTDKDVKAGKAAGYHTGVVTAGFGELDKIRKAGPELIAPDFRNLRTWLRWING
ncbi:MAG: HAD family hydrolase [Elusimicrobia bacterium]|nr:HAD family hydrolase [Elusimicrobiota bacterium]